MRRLSARQRLVAGTCVLALLIAAAIYAASGTGQSYALSPEQVVGADAPVGESVKVSGIVESFTAEGCQLTSGNGKVRVDVTFAEPQPLRDVGSGVMALVTGRLDSPGMISEAELLAPSNPSKYSDGQRETPQ